VAHTMFRDVVDPSVTFESRTGRTLWLSIIVHTAAVGTLIVLPLAAPDLLPMPAAMVFAFTAPPPPPPLPPALSTRRVRPATHKLEPKLGPADPGAAPIKAPDSIRPEVDARFDRKRLDVVERSTDGIPGGIGDPVASLPLPPAPVKREPESSTHAPLRPGGLIKQPVKVKDVRPIYPAIAQAAHVEGFVIIEATIGPTGNVVDARVLRSVALLDAAALDAVRQWQFTPTLLNGTAVPVLITVTVDFKLR